MNKVGKKKRVTVKLQAPNPLFEKWLTEWRDEASERESKSQHSFGIALKSLKKYPLTLDTGEDCKILHGFGKKLCQMLDDKLLEYRTRECDPPSSPSEASPKQKKVCLNRSTREYIPQHGSGAYAILVCLNKQSLKPTYLGFMTKAQIIEEGQRLSNKSFVKPDPGLFYTAWSSMRTLLEKGLVLKRSNPAKFSLSDEGRNLALKLVRQNNNCDDKPGCSETLGEDCAMLGADSYGGTDFGMAATSNTIKAQIQKIPKTDSNDEIMVPNVDKPGCSKDSDLELATKKVKSKLNSNRGIKIKGVSSNENIDSEGTSSTLSSQSDETLMLYPNSFEIILLIDNQELSTRNKTPHRDDALTTRLTQLNVPHEVRCLKVGDYVWICRSNSSTSELVLPYVVERKRMDDLWGSIKDGRFHEQKFRLKQCGLPNLIYLVENYGKNIGLPFPTLQQAIANTLIQDGFTVKITDDSQTTAEYLATLTGLITSRFKEKTIVSCVREALKMESVINDDLIWLMHFKEFNRSSVKNKQFKIKEMFVKQLLQIKGMSVEKAVAVVDKYPSPRLLMSAFAAAATPSEGEKLVSTLQYGNARKNVGLILSKVIYQLFMH